jgi:membrane-anchored protein YejM (alkaline phosphatase superfamily)
MNNNGLQYPSYPSILQYWLAARQEMPSKAWIITSKKKLETLGNCSNIDWRNTYLPTTDAVNRKDVETFERVKEVMTLYKPHLLFVNLSGADLAGHSGSWQKYLENTTITDSLLFEIVNLVDSLPHYKDETTVIMTNDHGRHLDGVASGFKEHGDKCHGCTHLNFFAYGPDFNANVILKNTLREQIDVVPTVAHLLGVEMSYPAGNVMTELFK